MVSALINLTTASCGTNVVESYRRYETGINSTVSTVSICAVLGGVQVFPYGTTTTIAWFREPVTQVQLRRAALCASGPVLVFWPPTRHTFLPGAATPLYADGINERVDEMDPEDEVS